ncbi:FAD-dependent oxidoreductase [Rothia aerolata]|uniref:Pyridine nucleotide-disulfide oxidoreductase n=1 Tax=Rothia aerolata TaxID=1812262 RepID=A0A917IUX9_9MICC|nr:FAD-dependent oxidoreductase [Rothia aerolata]GGH62529.1 pyridine nucleotide-disulfide oxidoreductase [Rothia aerolata]
METLHFDLVVIGFGKAGKTLAWTLAAQGKNVALIEQSNQMYGGTCINIGCVPTKALVHRAEQVADSNGAELFEEAVAFRGKLTEAMRAKNKQLLVTHETAKLIDGHARFVSDREVEVTAGDDRLRVTADYFVINTGASPVIPEAEGINESRRVFTSTELQTHTPRPQRLAVVGGGPIGIEFASMFAHFGSEVTVFNRGERLFGSSDPDVAEVASQILSDAGVKILNGVSVTSVEDGEDATSVGYRDSAGEVQRLEVDAVLVAAGRRPATEDLGLENTSVKVDDRGAIEVDQTLHTSVPHIFAVGDVNGGPQFTYISLDDFRIVLDQLVGEGKRSAQDRFAVATTTFMTPPLSQVGMTEQEAQQAGKNFRVASKPVDQIAAMPKAKILETPQGVMKFVIDTDTDQILGAQLLVVESVEVINLVAMAMRAGITATQLRNSIYTHPSVTEGLNEVLA